MENDKYFSMKEAANYLNMGYEALRYHVIRYDCPPSNRIDKKIRLFLKSELDAWHKIDKRKQRTKKPKMPLEASLVALPPA
jgi:hypothetical protein